MPQLSDMLKRVSLGGSKPNLSAVLNPPGLRRNGQQQQQQPPGAGAPPSPARKTSLPLQDLDEEAEAAFTDPDLHRDVFDPSTRLARTTSEVLADDAARAHFGQYLEVRDAVNLVKFWEEVQAFKAGNRPANRSSSTPTATQPPTNSDDSVCSDAGSSVTSLSSVPQSPNREESKTQSSSADSFDSGVHSDRPGESNGSPPENNNVSEEEERAPSSKQQQAPRTGDAIGIYQRFIAPDCPLPIHLTTEITHEVVRGICTDSGAVDESCFDCAIAHVAITLDSDYFRDFLRSENYAKYQVDLLTSSGPLQLGSVLYNDALLSHFMEFMEEDGGDRDLLEFWLAANNFRENTSSSDEHVRADALVIYERFISLQATSPLGLSAKLRSRIEESICSPSGVTPKCFDPAIVLAVRVLQQRYLAKFLNSNLYRKYLSELFSQIQTGPYKSGAGANNGSSSSRKTSRKGFGLRRSGSNTSLSTCSSSEVSNSISTHNTLLAMSRSKSTILTTASTTSHPDEDPDSIWRRPSSLAGGGNIGHIDRLGRYRSHCERAPTGPGGGSVSDKAAAAIGSKMARAMKRLVTNDIDSVQEELAWQMAERIVRDVTDVTLSPTAETVGDHQQK